MLDYSKCVLNVGAGFDSMPFVHHSRRFAELHPWARPFSPPTAFIFIDSLKFYQGPRSEIKNILKERLQFTDSRTRVETLSIEKFDYLSEFQADSYFVNSFSRMPLSFLLRIRLTEIDSNTTEEFDLVYMVGNNHDVLHGIIARSSEISVAHFRARRDRGEPRVFTEFCRQPQSLLAQGFQPQTLFTSFENSDQIAELAKTYPISLVANQSLMNEKGTPCSWYSVEDWQANR